MRKRINTIHNRVTNNDSQNINIGNTKPQNTTVIKYRRLKYNVYLIYSHLNPSIVEVTTTPVTNEWITRNQDTVCRRVCGLRKPQNFYQRKRVCGLNDTCLSFMGV